MSNIKIRPLVLLFDRLRDYSAQNISMEPVDDDLVTNAVFKEKLKLFEGLHDLLGQMERIAERPGTAEESKFHRSEVEALRALWNAT